MKQRGFTLLEVLLGGGVLTVGMISLLFVSQGLVKDLTPEATVGEMPPATYPLLERFVDGNIELFKASAQGSPAANYTCVIQGATLSAVVSDGTSVIGPTSIQSTPRLVRYQLEVSRMNALNTSTTPVARVFFWRLETTNPGAFRGQ